MSADPKVPDDLAQLLGWYDERFVRGAYLFVLGRPADDSGFAYYVRRVRDGVPRERVIVELASSDEARKRNFQATGLAELLAAERTANPLVRKVTSMLRGRGDARQRGRSTADAQAAAAAAMPAVSADVAALNDEVDAIFRRLRQALSSRRDD